MLLTATIQKAETPSRSLRNFPAWLRSLANLRTAAILSAALVVLPILVILSSFLRPEPEIWRHIADTLLLELITNTGVLCIGVLAGTLILGVGSAWLMAVYEFPGRKVFNWALVLPLAMPTYVLAFVFIGLLDFSGPVQTALRAWTGGRAAWFPDIRSSGGVILVLSLALYPYVFLLARNAFHTQGRSVMEVSRALGKSPARAFFSAALPMARPWIAGGLMLVLMETLADFGAVSIFNYDTFTTGIYKAWFGFFSISAAAQLSSLLLVAVFLLIIVEQHIRSKMHFHQIGRQSAAPRRMPLTGWKGWSATTILSGFLLISFGIPFLQLAAWSLASLSVELDSSYVWLLLRSLLLSTMAAGLILLTGLLMAYVRRQNQDAVTTWSVRLATMGYALPGTVLAVGIAIMINALDRPLVWIVQELTWFEPVSILNGTIITVLFAYTARFLTAGYNSINASMLRITKSLDEASSLLGVTGVRQLFTVHAPMLRHGLTMAAMLVFVDVMKEMPITLMTRPFGWDTLAVKIFELTSEGEWQRAALPSITLVIAGLVPLILLNRKGEKFAL